MKNKIAISIHSYEKKNVSYFATLKEGISLAAHSNFRKRVDTRLCDDEGCRGYYGTYHIKNGKIHRFNGNFLIWEDDSCFYFNQGEDFISNRNNPKLKRVWNKHKKLLN